MPFTEGGSGSGNANGIGDAEVIVTRLSDGRYTIDVNTQPSEYDMHVVNDVLGITSEQDVVIPGFLDMFIFSAERVGRPERMPDGSLILRGRYDVLAPGAVRSTWGSQEEIDDYENMLIDIGAEGYVEWEIWVG